jgi:hypothetical protein
MASWRTNISELQQQLDKPGADPNKRDKVSSSSTNILRSCAAAKTACSMLPEKGKFVALQAQPSLDPGQPSCTSKHEL